MNVSDKFLKGKILLKKVFHGIAIWLNVYFLQRNFKISQWNVSVRVCFLKYEERGSRNRISQCQKWSFSTKNTSGPVFFKSYYSHSYIGYFVGDYLPNPWTSEATCFRDRKLVSPYYLKLCFILPNHSLSALEAPADLGVGPQEVVCYYRYCRGFFFQIQSTIRILQKIISKVQKKMFANILVYFVWWRNTKKQNMYLSVFPNDFFKWKET
jgi:hypothetical protein